MNRELLDALGAETSNPKKDKEGYFDFNTLQRALNNLRPLTNDAAMMLINQANTALDKALAIAATAELNNMFPGQEEILWRSVKRDATDIRGKLDWHKKNIKGPKDAIYDSPDDLKKYYLLAFRTYNSALQGKKTLDSTSYYKEVVSTIANYVQQGKKVISKGTNYLAWGLGITAAAAIGYGWYNLKMAKYKYGPRRVEGPQHHPELED